MVATVLKVPINCCPCHDAVQQADVSWLMVTTYAGTVHFPAKSREKGMRGECNYAQKEMGTSFYVRARADRLR